MDAIAARVKRDFLPAERRVRDGQTEMRSGRALSLQGIAWQPATGRRKRVEAVRASTLVFELCI